jgi:hypothetical protein
MSIPGVEVHAMLVDADMPEELRAWTAKHW